MVADGNKDSSHLALCKGFYWGRTYENPFEKAASKLIWLSMIVEILYTQVPI